MIIKNNQYFVKVVGNGLIAKSFKNSKIESDCLIFASGISDSTKTNSEESIREKELVISEISKIGDSKFVYFSSVFVNSDSFYYNHKKKLEEIISSNCKNYLIVRLPQVVGLGGNKNNLFNFLKSKIESNEYFDVYFDSKRSLVDVDDVRKLVEYCLHENIKGTIIFSEVQKLLTVEIVNIISKVLNKEPQFDIKSIKSYDIEIDNSDIVEDWINNSNINKKNYIENLIKKYCKHDKN